MSKLEDLMDTIGEVIDMKQAYRIIRRPYDEDFATANHVTLDMIQGGAFIPCLMCGEDVVSRTLMNKKKAQIVFCSKNCRTKHGLIRLKKFDEDTNIRLTALSFIKLCLDIDVTVNETDVKKRTTPLVVRKLLAENNRLLELILEELRHAHR